MEYQTELSRRDFLSGLALAGLSTLVASSCNKSQGQELPEPICRLSDGPKEVRADDSSNYTLDPKNSYVLMQVGEKDPKDYFTELSAKYDPRDVLFVHCSPEIAKQVAGELKTEIPVPSLIMIYQDKRIVFDKPFDSLESLRNAIENTVKTYTPGKDRLSTNSEVLYRR